jgi:serine protease Do
MKSVAPLSLPARAVGGSSLAAVLTATLLALTPASPLLLAEQARPPLEAVIDSSPVDRNAPAPASFAPIVGKAKGSVVNIFTTQKVQFRGRGRGLMDDPLFRFFYGDPDDQGQGQGQGGGSREIPAGMGSGVIISQDGYILTNNHVIADMDGVKVKLQNGDETEYAATVVGSDPKTDIALLKVEAKGLPAITLGDSTQIEVGDRVFAIGNPFGVGQTVTSGIVSATSRTDVGITDYEDFIQTDASINPGNSGGALVDIKGRLIGVNSAILSRSGTSSGVGLAVPVNLAWGVVNSLATGGRVNRGYLGVAVSDIRPDVAEYYGIKSDAGALITDVIKGTPAANAGLRPGDVVTRVNGKRVNHASHLTNLIGLQTPGTPTKLLVNRQGNELELSVNLTKRDEDALAAMQGKGPGVDGAPPVEAQKPADGNSRLSGLKLADFDGSQTRNMSGFKTPPPVDLKGAIITEVAPGSVPAAKGLKPMDIITEIDHQPVTNAEEARQLAEKAKSKPLIRFWSASEGGYSFLVLG